jgi:SAM-dependent methyltransferase
MLDEQEPEKVPTPEFQDFEEFYASVGSDLDRVPWARLAPQPLLLEWLDNRPPLDTEPAALVIACGLGDDAEELSRRGYQVAAFDVSATAIAWCRRRFPNSTVDYSVQDLFALAPAWRHRFDLVLEVNTVQALPPTDHPRAISVIAGTVATDGQLLVKCFGREHSEPTLTRPYPLSREELADFEVHGLTETSFREFETADGDPFWWLTFQRKR